MESIIIVGNIWTTSDKAKMLAKMLSKTEKYKSIFYYEKNYLELDENIRNNTYSIIIGKLKCIKTFMDKINWKYNYLNMHYGWNNKIAVIYVTDNLSNSELEEYRKNCLKLSEEEIKKLKIGTSITKGIFEINNFFMYRNDYGMQAANRMNNQNMENNYIINEQYEYIINKFVNEDIYNFIKEKNNNKKIFCDNCGNKKEMGYFCPHCGQKYV